MMGNFKLTTVEEFEAATEKLLETGKKVGADAWQYRAAKPYLCNGSLSFLTVGTLRYLRM